MKYIFLFILGLSTSFVMAKEKEAVDTFFVHQEGILEDALMRLRSAENDNQRLIANEDLITALKETMKHPGIMDYPFEKLTTMSTIKSPDNSFRIFNWNVEDENLVHKHYGYIVKPSRSGRKNTVIELKEDKITITRKPEGMLTSQHWYGALYYRIIPIKKENKTYYTVCGFNGNDQNTNMKILDVFYFKGKSVRIGYPLFQESKNSTTYLNRVFFEYSEKASISVNMNEKYGAIIFDHLIPETPNLEGMYDFYIPDMSYDGYEWNSSRWIYKEDVIVGNDPNRTIRYYNPDPKNENDVAVEVSDSWIDPVDSGGPINNGGVDAVAPLETLDAKEGKKPTKQGKTKRKRFRLFGKYDKPHSAIGDTSVEKRKKKNQKKKKN
ncbi:MAG: hypothetical protein MI810_14240 [Flavobacteriales bacterium]|nr:hypothetical protein [Flavobacteriales bacterium]